MFPCSLQMMPASGTLVIFIEFLIMHWHFDPVLSAFVLVARAVMRVYMFHSHQFRAPVMSPFSPMIYTRILPWMTYVRLFNRESDSDTWLTPTFSVESDPSRSSYLTYSVGSYHLEQSHPSVFYFFSCFRSTSGSRT